MDSTSSEHARHPGVGLSTDMLSTDSDSRVERDDSSSLAATQVSDMASASASQPSPNEDSTQVSPFPHSHSPLPESSIGSPMSNTNADSPSIPHSSSSTYWNQRSAQHMHSPRQDSASPSIERDSLISVLEALHRCSAADLQIKLHLGGHLHRMLVEGSSTSTHTGTHSHRDDFREAGGFLVVIQLISTLGAPSHLPTLAEDHSALQIEIFKLALSILSASLVHHPLNIKVFEATVGWESLSNAVEIVTHQGISEDHVFGSLLGLALADVPTYAGRIVSTRRYLEDHVTEEPVETNTVPPDTAFTSASERLLRDRIKDQWTPVPSLIFPQAIRIILQLFFRTSDCQRQDSPEDDSGSDPTGTRIVLHTFLRLVASSRRNQNALASIALSSFLLDAILPADNTDSIRSIPSSGSTSELTKSAEGTNGAAANTGSEAPPLTPRIQHADLLAGILRHLYSTAGIPDKDGRKLLVYLASASHGTSTASTTASHDCDRVLDLLLDVAQTSQEPNTVLFSMAEHGHASLAFSTLRRPFPPAATSRGFTFITTFSIERIEPSIPIELLTLFDAQRSLHVQLFIEPGTGQFSYATTSHHSSPPTRFNKAHFVTGQRYNLAFVHLHPRGGAHMSPARLFINGELVEEKLAPWPNHNRSAKSASGQGHLANPVRAVLGSPPGFNIEAHQKTQENSSRPCMNRLIWSLGPTMLFDDAIPDDLAFIFHELGPRYAGNAQDSLGRFLTYRGSANINLRLDQISRRPFTAASKAGSTLSEKNLSNLPLVTAIAGRASDLVPEDRLYFVINAANTATFDRSGSNAATSSSATAVSSDPTKRSGSCVVLNQAVPLSREAVGSSYGLAKMYGEPTLLVPQPLDEMIWKLGGSAILLQLIADAETSCTLEKTLRLFLQLVSQSWRLSEDVERCKGYEVLGSLLHNKAHLFNETIVNIIYAAMGIYGQGDDALLINPFLYRIVMLDFELWAQTSTELQRRHLEHFELVLRTSRHRRFNVKRIAKMQIVKKLIHAVRSHLFNAELVPVVTDAIQALLASSFSTAAVRIITSYLATQLCSTTGTLDAAQSTAVASLTKPSRPRIQRAATSDSKLVTTAAQGLSMSTQSDGTIASSAEASPSQAIQQALSIFELLARIVRERRSHLIHFADAINVRWLLLFFHPRAERRAAELAMHILARLLQVPQLGYAHRLSSSGGFKVLERLLPRFWSLPTLLPILWSTLFGVQVPEAVPSLLVLVPLPDDEGEVKAVACAPVLRAILSCLKEGMLVTAAKQNDTPGARFSTFASRPFEAVDRLAPTAAVQSGSTSHTVGTHAAPTTAARPAHLRKRSQSMTFDIKALEQAAQMSTNAAVLQETAGLLCAYGQQSAEFRELLFSPIILRGLVECIFPFVGTTASANIDTASEELARRDTSSTSTGSSGQSRPQVGAGGLHRIAQSLLGLLAQLAADALLSTHSIAILSAIDQALPPTDLSQQTVFRSAILVETARKLRIVIARESRQAVASAEFIALFIETASEEILFGGTKLEDELYGAALDLLRALLTAADSFSKHGARAGETLYMSLNRIVLLRLANEARHIQTLDEIMQSQDVILHSANQDNTFFECLVNRLLHVLRSSASAGDQETAADAHVKAFTLFNLLALARPAIIEGEPIDTFNELQQSQSSTLRQGATDSTDTHVLTRQPRLVFDAAWNGISKSRETLKAAAHMERLQQLHDSLRRVDTREKLVTSTESRMIAWHTSLVEDENVRKAKFVNDLHEMRTFASTQWRELQADLTRERALLASDGDQAATAGKTIWRLDPTEGPDRIRLKLQQVDEAAMRSTDVVAPQLVEPEPIAPVTASETTGQHGDAWGSADASVVENGQLGSLASSDALAVTVEGVPNDMAAVATGEDSAAAVTAEASGESFHEDKYRRVLRSLERGDVIEAVFNTSRVVGIESRGCLLILGKLCVYLMDDYFQRPNGELINVWEAPPEERDTLVMATLAGDASKPSDLIRDLEGDAQTRKWSWSAVQICHRRSWLHRRTAVEIFFEDGQSCLLVGPETATAQKMHRELQIRAPSAVASAEAMREAIREKTPGAGGSALSAAVSSSSLGSRLAGAVLGRSSNWGAMTNAWREGRMSNFSYLMALNTLAGRSMNDLTQFPCFPWVLADYSSDELNLDDPASFRKLELPMGAQTPLRRKEFEDRYLQLQEVEMEPFHYGTHFSTASTVCGFLIRTRPFERLLLALQGGNFDLADRTFASVGKAWKSASELSRGDVRELIPEFFYLPEFLSNTNRFDFGITQAGEVIDDVELPPWAKNDARLFVLKHREALESELVSQRLHHWIDLIFGYRSRGNEAVESTNVFHPLSYEDAVDLDSIESAMERQAAAQVIHNFGQTPSKLFHHPHPQRLRRPQAPLPASERFGMLEHPRLIIQSIAPIRTLKNAVHFIYPFHPERAFASPKDYLILPKLGVSLSTDHLDGSLRMYSSRDAKRPLAVVEQMMPDRITCLAQARARSIVAGSSNGMASVWELDAAKREVTLSKLLRGHDDAVLCVAASSAWSIVMTGSKDRTAIVWDLNRGTYVRTLRGHESSVHLVAIDEKTCHLATASGPEVRLWSVNGELLARLATSANISEPVTSLAFFERDYHVGRLAVLLTGHRGRVIAWEAVSAHPGSTDSASQVRRSPSSSNSHHRRRRIASESSHRQGGAASDTPAPLWRLAPLHVFDHHVRPGTEGSMESAAASSNGHSSASSHYQKPLITAIATTPKMVLTGDEFGRLYQWTMAGEAVAVPDSFSSHCMNSSCGKRFGMLESRKNCAGCGGLFCAACAAPHSEFASQQRFCPHCHAIVDSSGYFDA